MKEYIVPVGDKGNMNMIENELHLQQLIRCKDCKYFDGEGCNNGNSICNQYVTRSDWFCADGNGGKTMPDREKVISEFSECVQRGGWMHCGDCEYKNANVFLTCKPLAKEILDLLKEQKAVEPIKDEVGLIHCGNCNAMLEHHPFYCWNCGQKVKWR